MSVEGEIFLTSTGERVISSLAAHIGGKKRVAFIDTATEVDDKMPWLDSDKKALSNITSWEVFDYTIAGKTLTALKKDLAAIDILYVCGGNTLYLLKQIQASHFDSFVHEHLQKGGMYIGQSAGAIVAGPSVKPAYRKDHAETAGKITSLDGMNITDLIVLPHWGSSELQETYFKERLPQTYSEDYKLLPLTDNQYAICYGETFQVVDVTKKDGRVAA